MWVSFIYGRAVRAIRAGHDQAQYLCTEMMDDELIESYGNDDLVLPPLFCGYKRHYFSRYDDLKNVEKKKDRVAAYENWSHIIDMITEMKRDGAMILSSRIRKLSQLLSASQ